MKNTTKILQLDRIADALERIAPTPQEQVDLHLADAFVWNGDEESLEPIKKVDHVELSLLKGIKQQRDILFANTRRFAEGLPSNNALLWGARGSGKSSLIKAIHNAINKKLPKALLLVELYRDDIPTLLPLLKFLKNGKRQTILFCDDLSFSNEDSHYKSLKAVLEGGIGGSPKNVIFYATSNRRHLMPRDMIENESASAINPTEAIDEKVSLSDRFGLWLGFHACDQTEYFEMIQGYIDHYRLRVDPNWKSEAIEWSITRGARSGRVAWQFVQDLAGRLGQTFG